ncbi:MAG: hypothetical protein ACOX4F_09315 [Atopobiaceae bacterium]
MKVETYEYGEGLGFAIDPESDTKQRTVILLGLQTVKCNPRPVIIYVTKGKINADYDGLQQLKDFAAENKVVFLCPFADNVDDLYETYAYLGKNHLELNVKSDEVSIRSTEECKDLAIEFKEYLEDEYDAELDEVEVL